MVADVNVAKWSYVGYGTVLRGDLNRVSVGMYSRVGDGCVVHAARSVPTGMTAVTDIGEFCTVGAGSVLRSVTLDGKNVVGDACVLAEGTIMEVGAELLAGSGPWFGAGEGAAERRKAQTRGMRAQAP